MNASRPYLRALGIGLVSGLRSLTGPAATRIRQGGTPALVLPLLALGELVADKLPGIPPRTAPPALAARALAGGFAGASLVGDEGDRRIGFALGAAGAIAAAYLALRLRRAAHEATGLPDPLIALVEDVAAVSAGLLLSA
ncbi:MAG: hypothetical protein QOI11_1168 [Candidatus Eremiobacteraeota bacterium]|jgi:uncharacterized membrane protein|nr:hypothetical protein [Candidatus Eremiobacteraeota bacterium]